MAKNHPKNIFEKERKKETEKNWFFTNGEFPKYHTQKRMNLSVKSAFHCAYYFW